MRNKALDQYADVYPEIRRVTGVRYPRRYNKVFRSSANRLDSVRNIGDDEETWGILPGFDQHEETIAWATRQAVMFGVIDTLMMDEMPVPHIPKIPSTPWAEKWKNNNRSPYGN
jgi:hypothetical protein